MPAEPRKSRTAATPPDTTNDLGATGPYQGAATSDMPTHVGRFQVRELLGEGAFGRVYRAYDPQLDREVALKVPRFAANEAPLVERFLREARAAARLRHPSIVAVFEAGREGGHLYIAAEFVAGQPLSERIATERPTPRQAAEWIRTLALALHYAHEEGIVHRDVKPSNIMVDRRGRVQLMDFGLAKRRDDGGLVPVFDAETTSGSTDVAGTAIGTILGTPAYMAPEQARGELDAVGPHSDQYSLGVVLYELLTGHRPFKGKLAELHRRVSDPELAAEPAHKRNPALASELSAICMKALAKAPHARYHTLADLAVALQRWLSDEANGVEKPPRKPRSKRDPKPAGFFRRYAIFIVIGSLMLLGGALTGGYLWWLNTQLRQADQQAEESRRQAQQAAEAARQVALARDCDLFRERGLRLRSEGQSGDGLLWLARAAALAEEANDTTRQNAILEALGSPGWTLPRPSTLNEDDYRLWLLAGNVLLGLPLPAEARDWKGLSQELPYASAAKYTAFGAGGRVVLSADEPKTRQSEGTGRGQRRTIYDPIQLRDAATGKALGAPIPGYERLAFSPDGTRVVRLDSIWTVRDLGSHEDLGPKHEKDWVIQRFAFNHDGSRLALVWEGQAEVWDPHSVKRVSTEPTTFTGHENWKPNLELSPDGTLLACQTNNAITIWPVGSTQRRNIKERDGTLAVKFHPNGESLLVATTGSIVQFNLHLNPQGTFLPVAGVTEMVFSPDGRQLLTRNKDGVQLWDTLLKRPCGLLPATVRTTRMQFRPDGKQILLAGDGSAVLYPNLTAAPRTPAITLWVEAMVGKTLTADGRLVTLDYKGLKERYQQLEARTGIAELRRPAKTE